MTGANRQGSDDMAEATRLTRRHLLATAAAFVAVPPFLPMARPIGTGFHLVDGWVLTDRDLVALGIDAR